MPTPLMSSRCLLLESCSQWSACRTASGLYIIRCLPNLVSAIGFRFHVIPLLLTGAIMGILGVLGAVVSSSIQASSGHRASGCHVFVRQQIMLGTHMVYMQELLHPDEASHDLLSWVTRLLLQACHKSLSSLLTVRFNLLKHACKYCVPVMIGTQAAMQLAVL